ncbi:hypothetical protein [[Pseudomonas] boreopolis]|uniref:hypothetical protein n=1 Tax=Xanthomonas boreopolis TaxID=86183 RepID=UPI003DA0962E
MHAIRTTGASARLLEAARYLAFLASLPVLAACAGRHVKPDAAYADAPARTVRVAYDQDGDIYPRDTSAIDWSAFKPSRFQSRFGGPLRLKDLRDREGHKPYAGVRGQAQRDAEQALDQALRGTDMLVVLIHGFNNDYGEARTAYEAIRKRIVRDAARTAYLEVFWDGLALRSDKALDKAGYASFWPDALTYSNLAGQYGLRPLLNSIRHDVDLRFVTHSRGAAVALAALADPLYDPGIVKPATTDQNRALANPRIRTIGIAAFAPAIGAGHLHDALDQALATHPTLFLAGVNPRDFATSKSILSSEFWGDTSLGSDPGFLLEQQSRHRANFTLLAGLFRHGSEHALEAYFRDDALTACFFQSIDLGPHTPACHLVGEVAAAAEKRGIAGD